MGTGSIDYKAGGNATILPAYVPDFQRDYAWTTNVGEKLLQDLIYNTFPLSLVPNQGGVSVGDYHLGHMLTFTQNLVTGAPIVDGQQRLFTLTVIACHLRDKALELGDTELAWKIDSTFIWGSGRYGDAEMLFKPKNCDYLTNQKMNPYEVLLQLCEIGHSFQVTASADQNRGPNVSIQIDPILIPWMLRAKVKINFENGGVIEVSNSVNQGTNITSISGNLTQQDVALGEMGSVFLGQKSGESPIVTSLMGMAITNLKEKVVDFIDNGGAGIAHLATRGMRCTELKWSLESVNFDMTNFDSEGTAIRHFGITNSKSHKITLSPYDLLRAIILRIRDASPVTGYQNQGNDDYDLFETWKEVRSLIEKKYPKDPGKTKFFERYLQANSLAHGDVSRTFDEMIDANFNQITRQWNKPPVRQLLADLFKFLTWHEEIWDKPDHLASAYHEEEFYLLLQPKSFTQWIPLYLAAKNKFDNPNKQTSIVTLLKYVTKFFGKGSVLNNLNNGFPGVEPNQLWGEVPGWIQTINQLGNNPTDNDVTDILDDIKTDIDTLLQPITWTIANITTDANQNTRKYRHEMNNTSIRYLLCLIEKPVGGIQDGNGRYKNGMKACDVEHVLAKKLEFASKAADYVFTAQNFEESKHRLGNRLLLPKKANQHIKQISFVLKMSHPTCAVGNDCNGGSLHYKQNTGQWKLVDEFLNNYRLGGVWDPTKIDNWELEILTKYHAVWP